MNATLLMEVKKQILAEPNRFVMDTWNTGGKSAFYDSGLFHDLRDCGTAACIGGWTCSIAGLEVYKISDFGTVAAELLGIEDKNYREPFRIEYWPYDLQFRWGNTTSIQERALIAAERIDRYVDAFCPNFRKNYEEEVAS